VRAATAAHARPETYAVVCAAASWFLHHLEGGSATYNIALGASMDGPLNREALADSLNDLTARHEACARSSPRGKVCPAIHTRLIGRASAFASGAGQQIWIAAAGGERRRAIARSAARASRCGHGSSGWTIGTSSAASGPPYSADGLVPGPLARDLGTSLSCPH